MGDVAECFIANADGSYLELNLAPNAAWWACRFSAPRQRETPLPLSVPGLETHCEVSDDGGWLCAMSIPLDFFGPGGTDWSTLRVNVCFILGSDRRRYLSAIALPGENPDFHQPAAFATILHISPPPT